MKKKGNIMKKISFEADKPESRCPKVEVGQYWRNIEGNIYKICRTIPDGKYALYSVSPSNVCGTYGFGLWAEPVSNINLIFREDWEAFELLESGKIIIEI